ncbi:ZIP family metal transporter [Sphingobium lignivorans]|uniref:ZIP family zinc transporter n=1 Tax=Sphingobium lignivorans TaxID=2735886 RepID=A0ABR6NCB0_9SPHN|nr:ZIP family metal transporter [Sphingobium lignivorans]MBB5984696.1 ZIP family zinc transporter [Sphingobium lignivorans]
MSPFWAGSLASLAAGLATGLGALAILALKPSEGQHHNLLGFAAGVMLAASFFSLIIPGIEQAQALGATRPAAAAIVVIAVLMGAGALGVLGATLPKLHAVGPWPVSFADARSRRIWLFIAAITLHNFPEGMAVAVSFGGGNYAAGMTTALGIGLQNIPEGLAVAGAAMSLGLSRGLSFLIALLSGLAEPIAGMAGAAAVALAQSFLPWALGTAAGAMIYIVTAEIIPDMHDRPEGRTSRAWLMAGLAIMIFLDVTLA